MGYSVYNGRAGAIVHADCGVPPKTCRSIAPHTKFMISNLNFKFDVQKSNTEINPLGLGPNLIRELHFYPPPIRRTRETH